jgi:hypothetical protein
MSKYKTTRAREYGKRILESFDRLKKAADVGNCIQVLVDSISIFSKQRLEQLQQQEIQDDNQTSSRLMPGSSLKLPLKHLNGHKTLGNPCIAGKLTVFNHSGQSLTLKHLGFLWKHVT